MTPLDVCEMRFQHSPSPIQFSASGFLKGKILEGQKQSQLLCMGARAWKLRTRQEKKPFPAAPLLQAHCPPTSHVHPSKHNALKSQPFGLHPPCQESGTVPSQQTGWRMVVDVDFLGQIEASSVDAENRILGENLSFNAQIKTDTVRILAEEPNSF